MLPGHVCYLLSTRFTELRIPHVPSAFDKLCLAVGSFPTVVLVDS